MNKKFQLPLLNSLDYKDETSSSFVDNMQLPHTGGSDFQRDFPLSG